MMQIYDDGGVWNVPSHSDKKAFTDAMRQSVRSAMQEEQIKREVIITRAEDKGEDETIISKLCTDMGIHVKPSHLERMGKKGERPRLLKATFPTAFDARVFMAKHEECRKQDLLPSIRMRSSKTKEQRTAFAERSKLAYNLNKEAKDKELEESYSLRDNGQIWKFAKNESGIWRRVRDWEHEQPSGNGQSPTMPAQAS